MDRRLQPQWTASGIVEAPVERVWQALLDSYIVLTPADKTAISHWEEAYPFTVAHGNPGQGRMTVEADVQYHRIALQGEWWYRGVHSVEPHPRGSLLVYQVYNIAPGIGWWAAQLVQGRQHARAIKPQFQAMLGALGTQLTCAAYPVDGQAVPA